MMYSYFTFSGYICISEQRVHQSNIAIILGNPVFNFYFLQIGLSDNYSLASTVCYLVNFLLPYEYITCMSAISRYNETSVLPFSVLIFMHSHSLLATIFLSHSVYLFWVSPLLPHHPHTTELHPHFIQSSRLLSTCP